MTYTRTDTPGAFNDFATERGIVDGIDLKPLVETISRDNAGMGRPTIDRHAIVRTRVMACLHRPAIYGISDVHWTLMNNPAFRAACGFNGKVPSRSTFSRVFGEMAEHPDMMREIVTALRPERKRWTVMELEVMEQIDEMEKTKMEDIDVIEMMEDMDRAYEEHAREQQEQADELIRLCNRNPRCQNNPDCLHQRWIDKMDADMRTAGYVGASLRESSDTRVPVTAA